MPIFTVRFQEINYHEVEINAEDLSEAYIFFRQIFNEKFMHGRFADSKLEIESITQGKLYDRSIIKDRADPLEIR